MLKFCGATSMVLSFEWLVRGVITSNCKVLSTDLFVEKQTFQTYLKCECYFQHIFFVNVCVKVYFLRIVLLSPRTKIIKNIPPLQKKHNLFILCDSQFLIHIIGALHGIFRSYYFLLSQKWLP